MKKAVYSLLMVLALILALFPSLVVAQVSTAYEVEMGALAGGTNVQNLAAASGGKIVGGFGAVGASLTQSVVVKSPGTYSLTYKFANNTAGGSKLSLYVNGTKLSQQTFPSTGAWTTFTDLVVPSVTLKYGVNTVAIQHDQADVGAVDFDLLTVKFLAVDPNAPRYACVANSLFTPLGSGTKETEFKDDTGRAYMWWCPIPCAQDISKPCWHMQRHRWLKKYELSSSWTTVMDNIKAAPSLIEGINAEEKRLRTEPAAGSFEDLQLKALEYAVCAKATQVGQGPPELVPFVLGDTLKFCGAAPGALPPQPVVYEVIPSGTAAYRDAFKILSTDPPVREPLASNKVKVLVQCDCVSYNKDEFGTKFCKVQKDDLQVPTDVPFTAGCRLKK